MIIYANDGKVTLKILSMKLVDWVLIGCCCTRTRAYLNVGVTWQYICNSNQYEPRSKLERHSAKLAMVQVGLSYPTKRGPIKSIIFRLISHKLEAGSDLRSTSVLSDLDDTIGNELIQFGGLVAGTLAGDLQQAVSPEATMCQMLIKNNLSDNFEQLQCSLES